MYAITVLTCTVPVFNHGTDLFQPQLQCIVNIALIQWPLWTVKWLYHYTSWMQRQYYAMLYGLISGLHEWINVLRFRLTPCSVRLHWAHMLYIVLFLNPTSLSIWTIINKQCCTNKTWYLLLIITTCCHWITKRFEHSNDLLQKFHPQMKTKTCLHTQCLIGFRRQKLGSLDHQFCMVTIGPRDVDKGCEQSKQEAESEWAAVVDWFTWWRGTSRLKAAYLCTYLVINIFFITSWMLIYFARLYSICT